MNYDAKFHPAQATEAVGHEDGVPPHLQHDVAMNAPGPIPGEPHQPVIAGDPDSSDQPVGRKSRRLWIIGAIVFAALAGLWYLMHREKADDAIGGQGAQLAVVSVIAPGRSSVSGSISATGVIGARREMPIGSVGDGGQVVQVLVEPGQWVRAGQALAVVDRSVQTQQAASLAAQVNVAAADARLAQSNLDRSLRLVQRGFISKADIDRLTATRDAANARVSVARAQLAEANARNRRLNIVSPAAGLVLARNVEPGQVVGPASGVLFRIAKDGQMEMLARLSEDDLARISVGVPASVTPVGSPQAFNGQVWQLTPVIDPQSRLGQARIALDYNTALRPGGFASAAINAGSTVASRLPESAILSDNSGSYVYIVDGRNKVVRRSIKTGSLTDDGIVVTEGLTGNERVVLRAGAFLAEGQTVKPQVAAR